MSITKNNLDKENQEKLEYGIIINSKDLIGYAIYEAIVCRSYAKVPISVDYMVRDINLLCEKKFEKISDDYSSKTFKDINELETWIKNNLMILDSFKQLNVSNYEFKKGITCDSKNRLHSDDNVENDFTDLDAYARNLAHDLLKDYLDIDYSSFK